MRDPPLPLSGCNDLRPLLLVVEGSHDATFLKSVSQILAHDSALIPNLDELADRGSVIFVPFGGGNPLPWTSRFASLHCPEFHLNDRELPPESTFRYLAAGRVTQRRGCRAFVTTPRSLENYLHPRAIVQAGGAHVSFRPDDCVATELARQAVERTAGREWKGYSHRERQKHVQRAKRWLNTVAVKHMTAELLAESDPTGDISMWLRTIQLMLPRQERIILSSTSSQSLASTACSCSGPLRL